jgi:glycosyltransferase involved in cell wall biosynthesis
MKLLLITHYFAPDNHVGAVRWNRLVNSLKRESVEVFVLAVENSRTSERGIGADRVWRIRAKEPWYLRLLGTAKQGLIGTPRPQPHAKVGFETGGGENSVSGKIANTIGKILRFPDRHWALHRALHEQGVKIVQQEKIDLVIATHPYPGCLKAASTIKAATGRPWIADMRDGWSGYYNSEYMGSRLATYLIRKYERRILATAACTVTINESLAGYIQSRETPVIIPNSYERIISTPINISRVGFENSLDFAFVGSVLIEHCWEMFFDSLREFTAVNKGQKVTISYYGNDIGRLRTLAARSCINPELLINKGYVTREKLPDLTAAQDILLVMGFKGQFGETVTTAKIFDYIELGKPIVAVAKKSSALGKLIEETGVGVVLESPRDIQQLLSEVLKNKSLAMKLIQSRQNCKNLKQYQTSETAQSYLVLARAIVAKNAHR